MSKNEKPKRKKLKTLKYRLPPENQLAQLYSKFKIESPENNNSVSENNNDNDTSAADEQPPAQ